jgi:hypothetical protein
MSARVAGTSKTILTFVGMIIFFSPPVYFIVRTWSSVSESLTARNMARRFEIAVGSGINNNELPAQRARRRL